MSHDPRTDETAVRSAVLHGDCIQVMAGTWLVRHLLGRTCDDWQRHDWDADTFDPMSLMAQCRRCGCVG